MSGSFAGTLCMFCATVGSIKTLSVVVNRISYGGTAMLTVFIGLGLVANSSVNISCEDRDLL